ncbi:MULTISPECIES: tetratricopeptide repeat protein [Methanosarcina]|nr:MULTISPECIES: tetratricopeptide repeat protein [Methanosarcina]AKB55672.1 TPR-domain containing protein [Methanosarcina barkeri MS]
MPHEALQAYKKALSSGTENCGIFCGLGKVYYTLGDYSRAFESFEEALRLDSENLFAWNGRGNALYKLGRYSEALETYETLLELDYESLPARYNRGVTISRLRHQDKDFDEILESQLQTAFKKYLELSGGLPEGEIGGESWKYRGFAFAELGEYGEALKAFEKATKNEYESSFPRVCKGITLLCLKNYEKALETFEDAEKDLYAATEAEKAIKNGKYKEPGSLSPDELNFRLKILWNAKGLTLDALGRYQDALTAFESAKKLTEAENIACSGKSLVFAHCGEWEKALKAFDRILTLDPQNTQASVMKAFALIRLQEFEKAISVLENLTTDEINSDLPSCLLGFACFRLGDFERALKAYRKAIYINPKNSHAKNGLAELYFRLGDSRSALKELEASIAEAPENSFSRNLKGRVELEEQACEEALESFRRALALDSEDQRLLLWDVYARYVYAEASFEENSARFRHMLLAAAGKLEKAAIWQRSEDNELKAYALYFLGLFYCRVHYFRKAADRLNECLRLNPPAEVKKPADLLLKNLRTGPLKPAWWKWWLDARTKRLLKKLSFGLIFLIIFGLLLSHPAASSLPIISWPAAYINHLFSLTGNISWPVYGREYIVFILFLFFILLLPGFRQGKPNEEELEPLTPPYPDLDIPESILEEFGEKLEKSLFSPEPMEESVRKLGDF